MPLPDLQQLIAQAIHRIAPPAQGGSVLNDIDQEIRAVLDITPQASIIETGFLSMAASVTSTPEFNFPETAFNETTVYHAISIFRTPGGANESWRLRVRYPGWAGEMNLVRAQRSEGENSNWLTLGALLGNNVWLAQGPIIVWPLGTLQMLKTSDILGGENVRLQYLREIKGGPFVTQVNNNATGQFT